MRYTERLEVFPGDVRHRTEAKTFEANSDEEALKRSAEIAVGEMLMVDSYDLEEYRAVGTYPKSAKPKKTRVAA